MSDTSFGVLPWAQNSSSQRWVNFTLGGYPKGLPRFKAARSTLPAMSERCLRAFQALFLLTAGFLAFLTVSDHAISWTSRDPDGIRLAFWLSDLLGIGLPCLLIVALSREARGNLGFRLPPAGHLLLGLLLAAGLWTPLWAADSLRARFFEDSGKEALFRALLTPGSGGHAMVFLTLAVAPAFFEELAFRGLLQPALTTAWGAGPGILSTAFLFALFHMSPAQTVVQFILGTAIGWMRYRTKSLWPCVLGHALHNGIAVEAMLRSPGLFGDRPAMPPLPWVAGGLALAALSAWALRQRTAGR